MQGCLGTTVNQGPMEIAHVFLQRNTSGQKISKKLQNKLRLCFKDFSRRLVEPQSHEEYNDSFNLDI